MERRPAGDHGFQDAVEYFVRACPGPPLAEQGLRMVAYQRVPGIVGLEDLGSPVIGESDISGGVLPFRCGSRLAVAVCSSRLPFPVGAAPGLLLFEGVAVDPVSPWNGVAGRGCRSSSSGLADRVQRPVGLDAVRKGAHGEGTEGTASGASRILGSAGR